MKRNSKAREEFCGDSGEELHGWMTEESGDQLGFRWEQKPSAFDITLLFSSLSNYDSSFTVILVYVDDLVLAGFEVARTSHGISISQHKYCLNLLQQTSLLAVKPASTPMDPSHFLHCDNASTIADPTLFKRLIGKLIYLINSLPDISFSICRLILHLAAPTYIHMRVAFRILRYLKNTSTLGLCFQHNNNMKLTRFSYSDWGLPYHSPLYNRFLFLFKTLFDIFEEQKTTYRFSFFTGSRISGLGEQYL
ncbi:hypothetical protein KIW84_077083 [Lathyrus oleraceus]|uniref:Mitochondrial protein n=1 Tax=Pisum sativum TaxID=3888 RepID=A0A9D4W126_PEA|nr:hypothetical protein KIW84_077083 [Pisum sativum]